MGNKDVEWLYIRTHALWIVTTKRSLYSSSRYLLPSRHHHTSPRSSYTAHLSVSWKHTMLHSRLSFTGQRRLPSRSHSPEHTLRPNNTWSRREIDKPFPKREQRKSAPNKYPFRSTHSNEFLLRPPLCPRPPHLRDVTPRKSHIIPILPRPRPMGPLPRTHHPLRRATQPRREPNPRLRVTAKVCKPVFTADKDAQGHRCKVCFGSCCFWDRLGAFWNVSWTSGSEGCCAAGVGCIVDDGVLGRWEDIVMRKEYALLNESNFLFAST